MSVFRSYFKKNNTLIDNNLTNNSQNPVTEVSYGTFNKQPSRFILEIDFEDLQKRIADGLINPNKIVKHVLHMTNTISYAPQYLGKKSYSLNIERASSFELDLFNVDENWDEGSGYDFTYTDTVYPYVDVLDNNIIDPPSNWYYRKTNTLWTNQGAYLTGETQILGSQRFEKGNENLEMDITDYVNQRLFGTGYTGTSAYTGASYGLGIKFADYIESGETEFRQAVAFHAKGTNTWYEPYIETIIDDRIVDDRNYFYLDKPNNLYLYVNIGSFAQDIIVNKVDIYDYQNVLIETISGITGVTGVSKGIYNITLEIKSDDYPDAVLFKDVWNVTINGRTTEHVGEFYLISQNKYYTFDQSNQINIDNYFFYFWGIAEKENIVAGALKKIKLTIKELYANQNNFLPLDIEYRLYTTLGKKYEIDVIPFTPVNRTNTGYEFNLDTSWLIPQDYFLQIRMKNGNYYENKQTVSFTVVSDGIMKA
jgi:hypothetical protein